MRGCRSSTGLGHPHEETINGERFLVYEGQTPMPVQAPNPLNEDDMNRYWRDGEGLGRQQHREGGMDIELRLADLEKDGVSAEVIYPQAVFKMFSSPDAGYQKALAELYNDYHHEVFGEHYDTFAMTAEIPMVNIDDGITEAKRVAKMGYKRPVAAVQHAHQELQPPGLRAVLGCGGRPGHPFGVPRVHLGAGPGG